MRSWTAKGGGLLLLAAVGAAAWWAWPGPSGPVTDWRTAAVERGPLEAVVSATGTVNPVLSVNVGSQVSGQLAEVRADFNTEVREGEVIARIDPKTFELRVQQARADLEAARAQAGTAEAGVAAAAANAARARLDAQNTERDLARRRGLRDQGFISAAEFDTASNLAATQAEAARAAEAQTGVARAQAESARAAIRQRESVLASAEVDLGRTVIRSPVDGVVIKRSVSVGQTVAASLQAPELFIIARNLRDMQVEVSVDEADIGRVQPGQTASFTVDTYPDLTHEGVVEQVRKSATNVQNVITYTAVVRFANPDGRLLPGMTANVRIATDRREDALKIPNAALRVKVPDALLPAAASGAGASAPGPARNARRAEGAGRPGGEAGRGGLNRGRVWRLLPDGTPQELRVRLGLSDGSSTEVLPADKVEPGAPAPLQAGDLVLVASPPAPEAAPGLLNQLFGGQQAKTPQPAAAPRVRF